MSKLDPSGFGPSADMQAQGDDARGMLAVLILAAVSAGLAGALLSVLSLIGISIPAVVGLVLGLAIGALCGIALQRSLTS